MRKQTQKKEISQLKKAFTQWGFTWGGIFDNRRGEWWLFGQLLLIGAHLFPPWPANIVLTPSPRISLWLGIFTTIIGIILSIKSFIDLGASLSPLPEPKEESTLVIKGSYIYCRHPLYQSLIISSLGVAISLGSILHFLLLIALTMLLIGKAKREEQKLMLRHDEYNSYKAKTAAIIPGIPILDWRN